MFVAAHNLSLSHILILQYFQYAVTASSPVCVVCTVCVRVCLSECARVKSVKYTFPEKRKLSKGQDVQPSIGNNF